VPLPRRGVESGEPTARTRLGLATLKPLVLLGPARSYTTVVTAMLGQHPQLYGFPETHLLVTRTLAEWSAVFSGKFVHRGFFCKHSRAGLLRLVAELIMGAQTEAAIRFAQLLLMARMHQPSSEIFRELALHVFPRTPIDKSPLIVQDPRSLRLVHRAFPNARFLHLTRHPQSHGRSMLRLADEMQAVLGMHAPLPSEIRASPALPHYMCRTRTGIAVVDPQIKWYREHLNILGFLADVPGSRQLRLRGEDLLTNPDAVLRKITLWLGLRCDRDALDRMRHPERWAFAGVGPPSARFGNDPSFCRNPVLRLGRPGRESLDDPVSWRASRAPINRHVRRLAEQLGYH
jgi:hypothetical protein